jgi:hypothetical protein
MKNQTPKLALEVIGSREAVGGLRMDREYGFKGFFCLERRRLWITNYT